MLRAHPPLCRAARRFHALAILGFAGWLGCSAGPPGPVGNAAEDAGSRAADSAAPSTPPPADGSVLADATPDGGTEPPVTGSPACTAYCDLLMGSCVGDTVQFATKGACLRACVFYPPGTPGDDSGLGNNLRCRQQHAEASATSVGHCYHAGAYGLDGCGTSCEGFCQLAMGWCAASAGGAPFASAAACAVECEAFTPAPPKAGGIAAFNSDGPKAGNTLDCRQYQLVTALKSLVDRDLYCPRAATISSACR